mgnify:CR=1 FL=1
MNFLPILGSIASSIFSARSARRRAEEANKYNSPKEQIARLRQAGISPGMYYSGGGPTQQAVVEDAPQFDKDMGTSEAITATQDMKKLNLSEKVAAMQIKNMEAELEGKRINNQLKSQQLNRYNSDRDLELALKTIASNTSVRAQQFQEYISQKRLSVTERAQQLGENRLNFDKEAYIVDQNLRERVFDLQKAKTYDDMRLAQSNYMLDAARYLIQKGQLDVSNEQLSMAWKKYDNDYALMEAINSAFDGQMDWKGIIKSGAKNIPRAVVSALRRFIIGK